MCVDPLTAGSIAAVAGGTGLDFMANRQASSRAKGYMADESARQAGYDAQQSALFGGSLADQTRAKTDERMTTARDTRAADSTANLASIDPNKVALGASTPDEIKTGLADAMAGATDRAKSQGERKANLESWTDANQMGGIGLARTGQQIANIGDFSRRSSAILPMEIQQAQQAGGGLRTMGALMKGLGQLGAMYSFFQPAAGAGGAVMGRGPTDPFGASRMWV